MESDSATGMAHVRDHRTKNGVSTTTKTETVRGHATNPRQSTPITVPQITSPRRLPTQSRYRPRINQRPGHRTRQRERPGRTGFLNKALQTSKCRKVESRPTPTTRIKYQVGPKVFYKGTTTRAPTPDRHPHASHVTSCTSTELGLKTLTSKN